MKRTPAFPALRAKIENAIAEAAQHHIDGADKREMVINAVVAWVDKRTSYPATPLGAIAEAFDGPVIRLLVAAIVQEVYDATKQDRP
jgi:hypothetical protein